MRISDWSSDVCSSDLGALDAAILVHPQFDLPKNCIWMEIHKEPLMLIAPASLKVADPLETLLAQPYICSDRSVVGGKIDRKSVVSGKSVSVRVDLSGRRIIKKKKKKTHRDNTN